MFGDHDKMIERFCLEQFLRSIPPFVRNWLLDREKLTSVRKAAELAEEFVTRRELIREDRFVTGRKDNEVPNYGYRKSAFEKDRQGDQSSTSRKEKDVGGDGNKVKDKKESLRKTQGNNLFQLPKTRSHCINVQKREGCILIRR